MFDRNSNLKIKTGRIKVDQYFPPVAGSLCWLMKLKRRINYPAESIKLIDHPLLVSQSARDIATKYDELSVRLYIINQPIFKIILYLKSVEC